MPQFDVRMTQAVWEQSMHRVQAESADEALEKVRLGEDSGELLWCQVEGSVDGMDPDFERAVAVLDGPALPTVTLPNGREVEYREVDGLVSERVMLPLSELCAIPFAELSSALETRIAGEAGALDDVAFRVVGTKDGEAVEFMVTGNASRLVAGGPKP